MSKIFYLFHPFILQNVGKLGHLGQQLGVGDLSLVLRIIAFPEKSNLRPVLLDVAVEGVEADVGLSVLEPLDLDGALSDIEVIVQIVFLSGKGIPRKVLRTLINIKSYKNSK